MGFLAGVLVAGGIFFGILMVGAVVDLSEWIGKVRLTVKVVGAHRQAFPEYNALTKQYEYYTSRITDLEQKVADFERRFKHLDEYVDTSPFAFPVQHQQRKRWEAALSPVIQRIDGLRSIAYDAKAIAEAAKAKAMAAADADEDTYDTLQQHVLDGHPKK